jgi:hypothetical protein
MARPWQRLVGAALALAAGAFTFPPERRGAVEAVLEVQAAERASAPGLGAATYTLRVRGPAGLEVAPVRLGDAAAAWKAVSRTSSWSGEGGGAAVAEVVELKQVKPGVAPLPDVRLRFREGPASEWQEVEWLDVLKAPRDVPAPEGVMPPAAEGKRWPVAVGLGLAVLVVAAVGWWLARRRAVPAPPLPPAARALAELDRLGPAPEGDGAAYHARLADVVRRYLAERFGLRAPEQTAAEVVAAARQVPPLAGAGQGLLREFFERCDVAKFAPAGTSPEECRRTAALARALVEQAESPT